MLIAAVFRDMAAYLDRDEIRQLVLDTVLQSVPASGRVVLVSHSVGTVVAMDHRALAVCLRHLTHDSATTGRFSGSLGHG